MVDQWMVVPSLNGSLYGSQWYAAGLCVPPGQGYLAFVATHGLPYVTDIALDNVMVDESPCNETTPLATSE